MRFSSIVRLARPRQWYKNLVIFVAILFSGALYDRFDIIVSIIGFISLCLVSSSGYVLNDIIDRQRDKYHPEKKTRPIASGEVSVAFAALYFVALLILGLAIAFFLSDIFLYSVIALFILSLLYSIFLKNMVFLDMLVISVNFVIRALSGVLLIGAEISPWLIVCVFFMTLLGVAIKRKSDLRLLAGKARRYKEVMKHYTFDSLNVVISLSSSVLLLSYCLYSFLRRDESWLITLPVVLYVMLRYYLVVENDPAVGRHPEKIFRDPGFVAALVLWCSLVVLLIYW